MNETQTNSAVRLYTLRQVAELVGYHPETVSRLIRRGELPVIDVAVEHGAGKRATARYRVRECDLAAWFASRRVEPNGGES